MHIGDIEECICEKQDKSKIKQHVILKIVPLMIPDRAAALLSKYIEELRQKNEIQNKIDVVQMSITRPWFEDIKCVNYTAATRATIQVCCINHKRPIGKNAKRLSFGSDLQGGAELYSRRPRPAGG